VIVATVKTMTLMVNKPLPPVFPAMQLQILKFIEIACRYIIAKYPALTSSNTIIINCLAGFS